MKTRQTNMPNEEVWSSFFSAEHVLASLELTGACRDVVEFGCGYGTFTIPAARIVRGTVHALDIDAKMVAATASKAKAAGLNNARIELRDFVAEGTGLPDAGVDYAMLFNILHCAEPLGLLREAWRVLCSGGRVGIMHWNHDPSTPRGPSMDIRPRPEQCRAWAEQAGFHLHGPDKDKINLPPYHYGWILEK